MMKAELATHEHVRGTPAQDFLCYGVHPKSAKVGTPASTKSKGLRATSSASEPLVNTMSPDLRYHVESAQTDLAPVSMRT